MSKYELSNEELLNRIANGDKTAEIAMEYRLRGKSALIDDLRAHQAEQRMEEQMLHGCE